MKTTKSDGVSEIKRQRRPKSKDGKCRDTARCYVTIDGKRKVYSLGLWNSPEAIAAYRRICADFYNDAIDFTDDVAETPVVTLAELFAKYLQSRENKRDFRGLFQDKLLIVKTLELFPDLPVEKFGALAFRRVRACLIKYGKAPQQRVKTKNGEYVRTLKPWSRDYLNKMMKRLRSIFSWGVGYDLTPPDVVAKIQAVKALRANEAPDWMEDREEVGAVPDEVVIKTLPFMQPMVADMIKIQRSACLRPSELCKLKVGDLDQSNPLVWTVGMKKHKTARFGARRMIAFAFTKLKFSNGELLAKIWTIIFSRPKKPRWSDGRK